MPQVGIKITGLKKIIKRNEQRIKAETWKKVMEKVMFEAEMLAKQLCPVSEDTREEHMRDTIKGEVTGDFSYKLTVGKKYASFNEWGWYGISGKVGSVEAPIFYKGGFRPFIRPSIWIMNKKYKKYIKNIIFSGHYY